MEDQIIYYGQANQDGEFTITICKIIEEEPYSYRTAYNRFYKAKFDKEIDSTGYDEYFYEEYKFFSFDKEKVEEFIREKRQYFVNKTKKFLEELESNKVNYMEE